MQQSAYFLFNTRSLYIRIKYSKINPVVNPITETSKSINKLRLAQPFTWKRNPSMYENAKYMMDKNEIVKRAKLAEDKILINLVPKSSNASNAREYF